MASRLDTLAGLPGATLLPVRAGPALAPSEGLADLPGLSQACEMGGGCPTPTQARAHPGKGSASTLAAPEPPARDSSVPGCATSRCA